MTKPLLDAMTPAHGPTGRKRGAPKKVVRRKAVDREAEAMWMAFMSQLRAAREDAGLTQREVCEKLGLNLKTLSTWELGKRGVHPHDLCQMLLLYGATFKVEKK